jgi:hypothetical protein
VWLPMLGVLYGMVWRCLEAYLPKRQNHLESLGRTHELALFVNRRGEQFQASSISSGFVDQ